MKIDSKIHHNGKIFDITYQDADDFDILNAENVTQASGVCFYEGKLVLVLNGKRKTWGLPGGTVEVGETPIDCLKREIREETNMEILDYQPLGYQKINEEGEIICQVRYACRVKPLGAFESDPAHTVTEVVFINPDSHKEYFDWQDIGKRLIQRGTEIKIERGW